MSHIILNGLNIQVPHLKGLLHGDWHKVGDCVVAYVCPEVYSLDRKGFDLHIIICTDRESDFFYRPARQDKWGTLVIPEQLCELTNAGQRHVKEWYPIVPFNFMNYRQ